MCFDWYLENAKHDVLLFIFYIHVLWILKSLGGCKFDLVEMHIIR